MRIEILTLFPGIFSGFLSESLVEKAIARGLLSITCTNFRDFADPPHRQVDDTPYGGGAGMVLRAEPLMRAIEAARARLPAARAVLLSASGTRFDQAKALELSRIPELILVCGRYEGVDQRVIELAIDEEISIGDYVLMGGEIPAMAVIEASARLIGDVIGNSESLAIESFSSGSAGMTLEAPQYTRPAEFRGLKVPDVLLSGDHKKITEWRTAQSRLQTERVRPDLLREKERG